MTAVSVTAVPGLPEITPDSDLPRIIGDALVAANTPPQDFDVLVVAQKVVSKAEGLLVDLNSVEPSEEAQNLARELSKDARKIEVVLRESNRVVRTFKHPHSNEGTMICEHVSGHISANAGVDQSNIGGEDVALLLPRDPDSSARTLHMALTERFGCKFGLVISDTFGRPWRMGQVNVAIGAAGLPALKNEIGSLDAHGREMAVTVPAFGDEIAAASGLVVNKSSQTPLVLIRGLNWKVEEEGQASDLVRTKSEDMFR